MNFWRHTKEDRIVVEMNKRPLRAGHTESGDRPPKKGYLLCLGVDRVSPTYKLITILFSGYRNLKGNHLKLRMFKLLEGLTRLNPI